MFMIWNNTAPQWKELPANWIIQWVGPVHTRENMGSQPDGHRCQLDGGYCVLDEVVFGSNLLELLIRGRA